MGDLFTEGQKAERLAANARISLAIYFPCPQCRHSNRPAKTKAQCVRLYLLDQLPPCRQCGATLRRASFDLSTIPRTLLQRVTAQLRREGITECPQCRQTLRAPSDKGSLKLRCPNCKIEFGYNP